MHLHELDLSAQLVGGESDDLARLDNSGLNTAHWNCSNASNFVNILRTSMMSNIGRLFMIIISKSWIISHAPERCTIMYINHFISKIDFYLEGQPEGLVSRS